MAYDSAATRARLIDAAFDEFVERGLAGARVDRIAAAARANKQAIYAYFGSKDGLFDAVLAARLGVLADEAPFTPDDLVGYAVALFDALGDAPGVLRLTQWNRLERGDATPGEVESHRDKAREVQKALGLPDETRATDVLEIVIAMSMTWATMPAALRAATGKAPKSRREDHRTALIDAVSAVCRSFDRATVSGASGDQPRPRARTTRRR
ncbi:TetR family transcriptional regulator [Actinoplanes sp. LDG1-06]|uniref:TetR family transcriptional regulator n=1 Tax=Paractinoplanes ovalisporus TaxID=2810368 RepID=A0ABS2A399_9ACTN|nr:TetR family transcriptional regulator [Actinoplanes ovalisporus]MBM2614326.1 TetR family transcriptional regulator [Actinoplanes ovalisporus]